MTKIEQKKKWSEPVLKVIEEVKETKGSADCTSGNSDALSCATGNSANFQCISGNSAIF